MCILQCSTTDDLLTIDGAYPQCAQCKDRSPVHKRV